MTDFLSGWTASERADKDVIKLKRVYIDMLDNLYDAVIFSQIMYWNTPADNGKTRLRVFRDGYWWIAKRYEDWQDECRINARTARASIDRMATCGLLEKRVYHFGGKPLVHIRIVSEVFERMIASAKQNTKQDDVSICQEIADSSAYMTSNVKCNCQEMTDAYTETTTEITIKTEPAASSGSASKFGYAIGDHAYWVEEQAHTYRTTIHEVEIVRFTKAMVEVTYLNEGQQHTVLRKPTSLSKTPPKLERKTTPMQDAIGWHVYSVPADAPIGKQFAIRLNEWESEIMTVYPRITPDHLAAAFVWKGDFKPGKVDTVIKMLGEYRDYLAANPVKPTQSTTAAQATRAALYGGES